MQTMVLLGAGASAESGVPMAYAMSERLIAFLDGKAHSEGWYGCCARLLRSLIGALIHQKAMHGEDPIHSTVDIEELITTARLLSRRECSPVAPFVDWRPLVDLRYLRQFLTQGDREIAPGAKHTICLVQSLRDAARDEEWDPDGTQANSLATQLEQRVAELSDPLSWEKSLLAWTLRFVWEYLDSVLWIEPQNASHLAPLVDLARAQGGLVVATLNFDTAVEAVCDGQVPCQTHAMAWVRSGQFPLDRAGITLLKLHGSVDWLPSNAWWSEAEVVHERLRPRIRPDKAAGSWVQAPLIAFGADAKLLPNGPFMDLLFAYKQALLATDRLLIVGYSFRDEHINEPIRRWFNEDCSREVIIIDPGFPEAASGNSMALRDELAGFETSANRKVRIVREKAGPALAYLRDRQWASADDQSP